MPADDLMNAWKTSLYAEKPSHHMRTNHRVSLHGTTGRGLLQGLRPEQRTPDGRRCSGMTFMVTHARGKEMAREFIPDE